MPLMSNLTYEERQAIAVLRKSLLHKPEIVDALMRGVSEDLAVRVLLNVSDELTALLEVNRAFAKASAHLVSRDQP